MSTTMIRTKYCGTAAKAGGNGENKPHPTVKGVSGLLTKKTYICLAVLLFLIGFVMAEDALFAAKNRTFTD